jgi:hypothetical protein
MMCVVAVGRSSDCLLEKGKKKGAVVCQKKKKKTIYF